MKVNKYFKLKPNIKEKNKNNKQKKQMEPSKKL